MFNLFTNRIVRSVPTHLEKLLTELKLTWLEQLASDIQLVEQHLVLLDPAYIKYAPAKYQAGVQADGHAILKLYTGTAVADYYPKDTTVYRRSFSQAQVQISYIIAEQQTIDFAYRLVWYPYVSKGNVQLQDLAEDLILTLQTLHQDNITHLAITLNNLAYADGKYHLINFEHGNFLPQVGKVNVKTVTTKTGKILPTVTRHQAEYTKRITRDDSYTDLTESMAIDKYQLALLLVSIGTGADWANIIKLLQDDADWKIITQAFYNINQYDTGNNDDFIQISPM